MCGGCRWQSIFRLRIWGSVARFWNKVFFTMIIILIVLFLGKWNITNVSVSYSIADTVGNNSKLELWLAHWPLEMVWTVAFQNVNSELGEVGGFWHIIGHCNRIRPYCCGLKSYIQMVHGRKGETFWLPLMAYIFFSLDAVREVRKYSGKELGTDAKLQPNMFDHLHMKLFRAQRNLYISGFTVFLWLWVFALLYTDDISKKKSVT